MLTAIHQKLKDLLQSRAIAYNKVFVKDTLYTDQVLKDLARFCRAHETTFHSDPRIHAVLEGRREVFLRIMQHLKFNADELYALHKIHDQKNEG